MTRIASRVSELSGEDALAVYSRAKDLVRQRRSVIHMELGEPDFHPAALVVDAVRVAVAAGHDRYCPTRGFWSRREALPTLLTGERTESVGRGVRAHSTRLDSLAGDGFALIPPFLSCF